MADCGGVSGQRPTQYGYPFAWCRSPSWVWNPRSLTAPEERDLPQLFNINRDIPEFWSCPGFVDGYGLGRAGGYAHADFRAPDILAVAVLSMRVTEDIEDNPVILVFLEAIEEAGLHRAAFPGRDVIYGEIWSDVACDIPVRLPALPVSRIEAQVETLAKVL